ncbi:MAG: tetratricopeptide repeat protein [Nitrospina sp.]|jgi:tetratricopeptide (TPR) repeat protein|nr:tetratricopeptide repeat protein [Nitrospina sp.]
MNEDGKDKTWKDKTGRKYQSYGVEQRLEREESDNDEEDREELEGEQEKLTSSLLDESEAIQNTTSAQGTTEITENDEDEEEEIEFDLEAQVEEFRQQIEEEPENCVHHYNLGEALAELEQTDEAKVEFERALELDEDKAFSSIIHFSLGGLYHHELIAGIQGNVVRSSVGLHSQHKAGCQIIEVNDDDYETPLRQYEAAIKMLDSLQADEEIVDHVKENAPMQIADLYYKWASDLIDKSRQIELYGAEVKDVKQSLKYLKKALELSPNHSQAQLMVKYARKMLLEGWDIYDEYGFVAKEIQGTG